MVYIPKKVNESIEEEIRAYILEHYQFNITRLGYLAGRIVKVIYSEIHSSALYGKSSMQKLLSAWFKTTNIRGDMSKHSAFGFATYIDKNYYILMFNRDSKYQNLIYKAVRFLLR